jgi:luciferase family oxidoreductase group 1
MSQPGQLSRIPLSVLDLAPVPAGTTPAAALGNSVELARHVERLGYRRYWVAEHHNSASLADPAPEILIAHLAAVTERIRVGSGGVMLPHYSPLKVAEQFRMLHTLAPGRIDLGIGRAPGTDPTTASVLGQMAARLERFPDDVVDLIGWLYGRFDPADPRARIRANPAGPGGPELWMLGSSPFGGALAARLGLAFSFAHFINPDPGPATMAGYLRDFEPVVLDAPRASVGVSVVCAETDAEAERLATSLQVWRRLARRGAGEGIPTVEDAEAMLHAWGMEPWRAGAGRMVLGGPQSVRRQLEEIAAGYGVEELLVVTICHDHDVRVRSYELLAEAFGLSG